jgi:hypothetical protein
MPKKREYFQDEHGRTQVREVGQDEDLVNREKYDPSLRSKEKSQAEVEASGGLAAAARRAKASKEGGTPAPRPTPTEDPEKKKKKLPGDKQLSALRDY